MADVQFFGIGASGFPDPNVQILTGNRPSDAEVKFFGTNAGPSPTGALAKESELVANGPDAEFTSVEFFSGGIPTAASLEPNDNLLSFYADGAGFAFGGDRWNLPIKRINNNGVGVGPDLSLITNSGRGPSGLCGTDLVFTTPTGLDDATSRFTPSTNRRFPIVAYDDSSVTFAGASGYNGATSTDRLFLAGADGQLRRTPVIEVILE